MTETTKLPQTTVQLQRLLAVAKAEGRTEEVEKLAMMLLYHHCRRTVGCLEDD